jgi:hypothetical protein
LPGQSIATLVDGLQLATVVKQEGEEECLAVMGVADSPFNNTFNGIQAKTQCQSQYLNKGKGKKKIQEEEKEEENKKDKTKKQLLVHERLVNMPLEIIAQMYRIIHDELKIEEVRSNQQKEQKKQGQATRAGLKHVGE